MILLVTMFRSVIDGILFLVPMLSSITCIVVYQKVYNEKLTLGRSYFLINMFNLSATPLRVFFFAII